MLCGIYVLPVTKKENNYYMLCKRCGHYIHKIFNHKSTNPKLIQITKHNDNLPVVNVNKYLRFMKITALGRNEISHAYIVFP